jgi:hypothetical protein
MQVFQIIRCMIISTARLTIVNKMYTRISINNMKYEPINHHQSWETINFTSSTQSSIITNLNKKSIFVIHLLYV